jgi:hypothetical protein
MTVMVDVALRERAKHDGKTNYVLEMLAEAPIQAHLYAASGPPAYAQRVTALQTGVEGVRDWVVVRESEDRQCLDAIYLKDDVPIRIHTQSNDSVFLHLSQVIPPGSESTDVVMERLKKDALALLIAKAIRADLYLTDRPMLVDTSSDFWWTTTVMRVEEALPIVGLYLRQQAKFVVSRSPALGAPLTPRRETVTDKASFYWQAAETLLPIGFRWKLASRKYAQEHGDDELKELISALTWRIDQVLRSRDRLLATVAVVPQDHSPADEALTELDLILLWLMSVFDITARLAHLVLDVPGKTRDAKWQAKEWMQKLAARDAGLARIMSEGGEGAHLLTILRNLRNNIHGEALSAGGMIPVVGNSALETLVRVPRRNRKELLAAMDALGEPLVWGVAKPFADADLHIQAGTFVERLLFMALKTLNQLMATVPASSASETDMIENQFSYVLPPSTSGQRILWQLGI